VALHRRHRLILREVIVPHFGLQRLQRGLRFVQGALGPLATGGFLGQRGLDPLQAAGSRAGLPGTGIRSIPSYNCHRNIAVLHEAASMHTLHEPAAGALRGLLPVGFRARPRSIAMQTKCLAHRLFDVIHWRRGLRLFTRQAHSLALVRV
jgi:hypothetical protein